MPKPKFNWLITLTRQGITSEEEDIVSGRIVFSNVVFISLPVVYFLFMVIDYKSFLQPIQNLRFDQFVVPIVILICFFNLWLNKIGFTTFSRILFIVLWPFLLHIIPIKLLQTPPDYYLAFPMGIIFHSILIQLMFSRTKEPVLFWSGIVLNLITLIFAPNILVYFSSEQSSLAEVLSNKYYALDAVLYWLLFNLVMFYIIHIIETYFKRINTSKVLIESQKEDLNMLNQNLEKIVDQRTSELMLQNEKLKHYAFYNSHVLKAPFCRIQGLLYLQNLGGQTEADHEEIRTRLQESVDELDRTIQEIQHIIRT